MTVVARARLTIAFLVAFAATSLPAHAADADYDTAQSAIIQVRMQTGIITIHTWDRAAVVVRGAETVRPRRENLEFPQVSQVPILQGQIGVAGRSVTLPQETFVIPPIAAGLHDVITVHGSGRLDLTIPRSVPLIVAIVSGQGSLTLRGYHGTFVTRLRRGSAHFADVQGVGFVQVLRGPITIADSSFDRLRARSGAGNIELKHCSARQIQISSINGSIVFDDGTFLPGLAQFASQNGSVAVGTSTGATVTAHTAGGKIYTLFNDAASVQNPQGDASVLIGPGGPVVTATSTTGNIYLYDGALKAHAPLPSQWAAFARSLRPAPTSPPVPISF